MAENSSKDLLKLEAKTTPATSTSCLESKLFVCKKESPFSIPGTPLQKPTVFPVPKSQFLGKVKEFLGVMSESNKKLMDEAKENPDNYDIEVLSGKESEFIEMDLMLGIADLHTPESVAAAESAIAGRPLAVALSESSSESEDEDTSDEDDDEDKEEKNNEQHGESGLQSVKPGSKDLERNSSCKASGKQKPNKRPKIIELS